MAAEFAELKKSDHVYDLYSGAGTISIYIANQVKHVLGVELIEAATINAKANAEANGISNVSFETGDKMMLFNAAKVSLSQPFSGLLSGVSTN